MKRLMLLVIGVLLMNSSFSQDHGIINNSTSPNVNFKSINIGDCQWTEGFWADKFKVCEETMVPYMGELLCGDTGHALNNFKIAAGLKEGKHKGMKWHDGDFYKWMEAEMYVYAQNKDENILADLDQYIDIIGKAQQSDGYLQTQVTIPGLKRYGNRQYHEMYNSGHLYTSACIHNRITGKTNFLDIAIKHADNLYETFQPQPEELARFGFNQTQIMGLVELYRTTKDKKYLELAELFINMRGKSKVQPDKTAGYKFIGDMVQERTPLRDEKTAEGHAVLALYFYAGAADVYAETGEKALIDALDRLWDNVVNKKMYVTGACGQTHHGVSSHVDMVHEGFINEYMMPNLTAYNETCANICNSMFSYRMLGIHGESKYADIMELVLFNSALSGISIEGKDYFYANPLRVCHHAHDNPDAATEFDERIPYVECFCCPPNLVRTIAKVSGWAYSITNNGVAVNLYGGNKLTTELLDGSKLQLSQVTQYPWNGAVKITMEECKKGAFQLMLRIPDWAQGSKILVNGKDAGVDVKTGTYVTIERSWKKGDVVSLDMPMDVKLIEGNPLIEEVRNQVAVKRGPVVYCVESPDLPKDAGILDVYLPVKSNLKVTYKPDFLGGVSTISADVKLRKANTNTMYSELKEVEWETYKTQFVPYFSWSNRGKSEMTVWIPIVWE
ncbi:glycoside hydrolase family 127 protein [Labilibaculum antarcticum]|uniref:Glycoside hydrolase family 127 protein n=1 Tax=Labilibaculum antarcticum TaxID=1717717 RepID=A0A1Y1CJK1_9BACT|nr:beta-L-arabinofuranosidase domain-containing protein [Labilibaculum antarcticum]BAX80566.1 hypothetical protein ALGA_2233 [Labilibaculum antarcticum]